MDLNEKDRTDRRLALPAHLHLDSDPVSLQHGARGELHRRLRPGHPVFVGGILELIVALAGIGTAVALYPVVKRQNEGVALGFVGVRTLEAATIFAGVFSLLSVVGLRRAGAGAGRWPPARRWSACTTGRSSSDKASSGHERPAARLPALPVPPGAADPARDRLHRCAPARRLQRRHVVRRQPLWLRAVGAARDSRSQCGSSRWASTSSSRASGRPACRSSASRPTSPRSPPPRPPRPPPRASYDRRHDRRRAADRADTGKGRDRNGHAARVRPARVRRRDTGGLRILGVPFAASTSCASGPQMGEIVRTSRLVADVEGNFPELTLEVGRRLRLDDVVVVEVDLRLR